MWIYLILISCLFDVCMLHKVTVKLHALHLVSIQIFPYFRGGFNKKRENPGKKSKHRWNSVTKTTQNERTQFMRERKMILKYPQNNTTIHLIHTITSFSFQDLKSSALKQILYMCGQHFKATTHRTQVRNTADRTELTQGLSFIGFLF